MHTYCQLVVSASAALISAAHVLADALLCLVHLNMYNVIVHGMSPC